MQDNTSNEDTQLPEKEKTNSIGAEPSDIESNYLSEENRMSNIDVGAPPTNGKNTRTSDKKLLFDRKQLELDALRADYASKYGERDPLDLSSLSAQQVELIALVCDANPRTIWDFCVGYAAVAMGRKGTADDVVFIGINKTTPVGLFYFAALTLFYSIEECSLGRIPPLQRIEKKLRELFYAISPVNKQGKAYTVSWDDSIFDLVNTLPYNSYTNPLITLAPHEGAQPNGDPILATTTPQITLDDIREVGPDAFEKVQRYFLADDGSAELVSYTMDDGMTNTSMFSVPRNATSNVPVRGFGQFVNETSMPQRDVWLMALGFLSNTTDRDGWNAKTVQLGTHHALYYLLQAGINDQRKLPTKTQTHMVNFATLVANDLGSLITAEFNSNDSQNLEDVTAMVLGGTVDFGYISQLTAGQLLRHLLAVHSRRFWLGSALCTGTPMPEFVCEVIGAGSRYLTTNNVDEQVLFGADAEELAGLSSYLSDDGFLSIPVLTIRGRRSTLGYGQDSNDIAWLFNAMFPQYKATPYDYKFATPGPGDPADIINHAANLSFTSGQQTDDSMQYVSSVISMLQPYNSVASATGSRDGSVKKMLYLTHFLRAEPVVDNIDRTPLFLLDQMLSTKEFDPRHTANVFTSLFPVMYGTPDNLAAYQTLLWRKYRIEINKTYIDYRAPIMFQRGHKRASNLNAPSEWGAHVYHDTVVGDGGNFMDRIFRDGGWIDSAKLIGRGIMDVIAPKAARSWQGKNLRTAQDVHEAVKAGILHPGHLAPITHGMISAQDYVDAIVKVEHPDFQRARQNQFKNLSGRKRGKRLAKKSNNK
jgi:hypothetical protein